MTIRHSLRQLLRIHIRHRKIWVAGLVFLLLVLCVSAGAVDYLRLTALQGVLAPAAQAHNLSPSLLKLVAWLCYLEIGALLLLVVGLVWWYLAAASAIRPDVALQLTTGKRNAAKAYLYMLYCLVYSTIGLLLIPSFICIITDTIIWLAIRGHGQIVGTKALACNVAGAAMFVLAVELIVPLSLVRMAVGYQMLLGVAAAAAPIAVRYSLPRAVWLLERRLSDETAMFVMIAAAALVVAALALIVRQLTRRLCLAQMAGHMSVDAD